MEGPSEANKFYFEEEGKMSNMGWILDKGLSIGRKVIITGVVVSSAPVVLPPLLAISALGVAGSLPFAVVFASYKCMEKLMNTMLPFSPASPHMLEYAAGVTDGNDEQEAESKMEGAEAGVEPAGGVKMYAEEIKDEKPAAEVRRVIVVGGGGKEVTESVGETGDLVVVARAAQKDTEKLDEDEAKKKQSGEEPASSQEMIGDEGAADESAKQHKRSGRKSRKATGKT